MKPEDKMPRINPSTKLNSDEITQMHQKSAIHSLVSEKFEILSELGEGGMGKVYLVWDKNLKREVALKVLVTRDAISIEYIQRFLREARSIAQLVHPNIIKLYEVGNHQGNHYYTMECIKGDSLDKYTQEQLLRPRKIATILERVASAIHYAHTNGIIHRDLKPANIMLAEDGQPYVMDFGLAKLVNVEGNLTHSGAVLGTPHYMSPEQAQGDNKNIDARSDIFALGSILYALLTNHLPFIGTTMVQVLTRVIEEEPILPRKINPKIPEAIECICLKAMAKNREQRYNTAEDFAKDLRKFLRGKKIDAPSVKSQRFKRNKSKFLIVFTILLTITGLYIALLQKKSPNKISKAVIVDKKLTAKDHYSYAIALIKYNSYTQAREELLKAFQLFNQKELNIADLHEKMVWVLVELKNYKEAQEHYQKLQKENLESNRVFLAMAKMHYHQEQYSTAQKYLAKILGADIKDDIEIYTESIYYQGLNHYKQKSIKNAIKYFKKTEDFITQLNTLPAYYPTLLYNLGICCFLQNDYIQTQDYLHKVVPLLPQSSDIYEYLGKSYLKTDDFEKAYQQFARCVALQPDNSQYQYWYGAALYRLKFYSKAVDAFSHALELDSKNVHALIGLFESGSKSSGVQNSQKLLYYLTNIHQTKSVDILAHLVKKQEELYHSYYLQWWKLKHNQPVKIKKFIEKLTQKQSQEVYDIATKVLLTQRYQENIESSLQAALQASSHQDRRRINQVLKSIRLQKQNELKFVTYYRIARFCINQDLQIKKELKQNGPQVLENILFDTQQKALVKYLAAKTLRNLFYFDVVVKGTKAKDPITALICTVVLKESKFPVDNKVFLRFSENMGSVVGALIAKSADQRQPLLCKKLLGIKDDLIKVSLAANLATDNDFKKVQLFYKGRDLLAHYCQPHFPYHVRKFALSYLCRSYTFRRDGYNFRDVEYMVKKDSHIKIMVEALKQPQDEIIKIMLDYGVYVGSKKYTEQLVKMYRSSNKGNIHNTSLLWGLWMSTPKHPIFKEVAGDASVSFPFRIYAFMLSFFFVNTSGDNTVMAQAFQKYSHLQKELPLYFKDPDPGFRNFIYYTSALLGNPTIKRIPKETPELQANLLLSLTVKSPLLGLSGATKKLKIKEARKYLNHPNDTIARAAHIVLIGLLSDKEREKHYNKYINSLNKRQKEGIGIGYYGLAIGNITNSLPMTSIFNAKNPVKKRKELVKALIKQSKKTKKRGQYIKWFERSAQFYEDYRTYYFLGILYGEEQNYSKAIFYLKKAVEKSPQTLSYQIELAHMYYRMGNYQDIKPILKIAVEKQMTKEQLLQMGKLAISIDDLEMGQQIYGKLCVIGAKNVGFLGLVRVYCRQKKYRLAVLFFCYAKYYTNSLSAKKLAMKFPEVAALLEDPWRKELYKPFYTKPP